MKNKLRAVRTVSETDDVRIIEGLGIPFGGPFSGRDSYRTFASPRTDFHWDLFPDFDPTATRTAGEEPAYIRPVTYNHGFDEEIGLARIGGWSPVRVDAEGVWVQAQLDKRAKWYGRIAAVLDADVAGRGGLGFSSGSAEHAVRFDDRTGEWLEWPVYELALTPTEANPLAVVAARAAAVGSLLAGDTTPPATRRGPNALRYSSAAWDASAAAWVLDSLISLLGEEAAETEQAGFLRQSIAALQMFIDAEMAEIGTPDDVAESAADQTSVMETISVTAWASGVRARQSSTAPAAPVAPASATAAPADGQPAFRVVAAPAVRSDAEIQRELLAMAEKAGAAAAKRLTGPPA
jgi:hypothetical protein